MIYQASLESTLKDKRIFKKSLPKWQHSNFFNNILSYCKDPKTIILCVIPANQDLSTSDGLKLAREWDKAGERTIGVITKIDIMDKGTNAKKMLMNEEIHLKLGYIGIVNRAQEDIINKVPVEVALKN